MAGVYFYVPTNKIRDIVDCGIKLSEWYDCELNLPGQGAKRVIRTLVNPRDDLTRSKDPSYRCIRLEVDPQQSRVGDGDLFRMGLNDQSLMSRYFKTLISLADYRFGMYRKPECLVFTSILPDHIEVTGKALDVPVLFENSEALYTGNIMDGIDERLKDSGNTLIYAYFRFLESRGLMNSVEDRELGLTVFLNPEADSYFVTKTP